MASLGIIIASIAGLMSALYLYLKHKHNYWAKRGIKNAPPNWFFGNLQKLFSLKQTIFEFFEETYFQFPNEKVIGFYGFGTPMLLIKDLDLIRNILTSDFGYFVNRTFHPDKHGDPLAHDLILSQWDEVWRNTRQKTTFAFTSGRMKKMYPLMAKSCQDVNTLFGDTVQKAQNVVDIRNITSRYTIDVITSCAFGSEGGAIKTPETSIMFKLINSVLQFDLRGTIALNLMFFQKRGFYGFLSRLGLGFKLIPKQTEEDIYKIVDIAAKQRLQTGERRGDIFDEIVFSNAPGLNSLREKAGVAMTMLVGGSETSASTIGFLLYELARNMQIQRRVQKEIRETLNKHNGQMPFEAIPKMEYLDMVLKETLRKYPILPYLDRIASKDYTIPGTDIVIEKGTAIFIPTMALHRDPQYFPDPLKFDPERFSKEHGQPITDWSYLPFGGGPRYCLGKRFAVVNIKSFLVYILKDFDVNLTEQSKKPFIWDKKAFGLYAEDALCLEITPSKRDD